MLKGKAFLIGVVAFGSALLASPAALAQGCALCYNDAAATGPHAIASLRHGILVLAIPPMLIFAALFAVLYRRRNLSHNVGHIPAGSHRSSSASEIILHLN